MAPDFPAGTIVLDSGSVHPALHRPITFVADGAVVTHILVGYNKDGSLITRGIANAAPDVWHTPVYPRAIRGTVIAEMLPLVPGFWLSLRGAVVIAGLALASSALYVGRKTM